MAYDKDLAARVESIFKNLIPLEIISKKMFGGICYLLNGNIACGVHQNKLIIRVGKEEYLNALTNPGTSPFDLTGRPMAGWVFVEPPLIDSDEELRVWVQKGVNFTLTLPEK